MTATIKVHALSRGGFFASAELPERKVCVSDGGGECSEERAAQKCALRVVGITAYLTDCDDFWTIANRSGIVLKHVQSSLDEEIYSLEYADNP